jgi:hypothetical protein
MVTSLDARLMTLPYKRITVAKSKEVKTRWSNLRQIWQNLLRKAMAQKRAVVPMMMLMMVVVVEVTSPFGICLFLLQCFIAFSLYTCKYMYLF